MMAETLRVELRRESSPHAGLAAKLVNYLNEAQQKVRQVSRGLLPVESDARGLMKALDAPGPAILRRLRCPLPF